MASHGYDQFGTAAHGNGIDPNQLAMGNGNYHSSFQNNGGNYNMSNSNNQSAFSSGSAILGDDELLDGLASPSDQSNLHGHDFTGMNMGYSHGAYQSHRGNSGLQIDPSSLNGYSHTPDGDPIQSPFNAGFNHGFRQMHNNMAVMGTSLHSPLSYTGSPLAAADINDASDPGYLNAKAHNRMAQSMQRKASQGRGPMTPKSQAQHGIPVGSAESPSFGPQSMRTTGSHDKTPPTQWLNTPSASIPASYQSGYSPMQQGMLPMNEVMMKAGTSMPAKLGVPGTAASSQEMKRKRRRESHNLVERRRRDNINERIQDLSKLVPIHRLEDEKIRKLIQNGTPLSPTLNGINSASQATSGLAGPGARRATGSTAGNITTGLPIEDKDKGPNKGDILNGAVSWTHDLMWMLHLKLQQQEELMNAITELGGHYPFEHTEDERRMQSELLEAISKNEVDGAFSYTRTAGSGLRVPHHTDYRGDPVNGLGGGNLDTMGTTPEDATLNGLTGDLRDTDQFWHDPDEVGSGNNSLDFKEEDEYDMDMTH